MGQKEMKLFEAIEKNDVKTVQRLIKKGLFSKPADVNALNDFGSTPLHLAVIEDLPEIAKALLKHNADVNALDDNGRTPLQIASRMNRLEFMKILILKFMRLLLIFVPQVVITLLQRPMKFMPTKQVLLVQLVY